mgnify:FL=1
MTITNQAVFAFYKYGAEALTLKQLDEVERLGLWSDELPELVRAEVHCLERYKLTKWIIHNSKLTQMRHTK